MYIGDRATAILAHVLGTAPPDTACILPANICDIVPTSLQHLGIRAEFVDISAATFALDLDAALVRLRQSPKLYSSLVYVHPYGAITEIEPFYAAVRQAAPDITIIDDRCLCPPGLAGCSSATVTLYSTGYAKYVDLGYGALGVDGDPSITAVASPAWLETVPFHVSVGDYLEAIRIAADEQEIGKARKNAIYDVGVPPEFRLPAAYQNWRYNILFDTNGARDRALNAVLAGGLFASSHYRPCSGVDNAPVAYELWGRVLNLFNDRYVTDEQVRQTAAIIALTLTRTE